MRTDHNDHPLDPYHPIIDQHYYHYYNRFDLPVLTFSKKALPLECTRIAVPRPGVGPWKPTLAASLCGNDTPSMDRTQTPEPCIHQVVVVKINAIDRLTIITIIVSTTHHDHQL